MTLYGFCQGVVRVIRPLFGPLRLEGLRNVPTDGPFLLVANHQSLLDPLLIQTFCPRQVHTMAKSSQFASPFFAWLMPRIRSFPVRRHQIDPQAVRLALRHLRQGAPVGIYLEGERTWDGQLQAPRRGAVRLILKAGVPVIPCTIVGAYDVLPRWHRSLRRCEIRVTFGTPMHFPKLDRRVDREAALEETADRLMAALAAPLGESPGGAPRTVGAHSSGDPR